MTGKLAKSLATKTIAVLDKADFELGPDNERKELKTTLASAFQKIIDKDAADAAK